MVWRAAAEFQYTGVIMVSKNRGLKRSFFPKTSPGQKCFPNNSFIFIITHLLKNVFCRKPLFREKNFWTKNPFFLEIFICQNSFVKFFFAKTLLSKNVFFCHNYFAKNVFAENSFLAKNVLTETPFWRQMSFC